LKLILFQNQPKNNQQQCGDKNYASNDRHVWYVDGEAIGLCSHAKVRVATLRFLPSSKRGPKPRFHGWRHAQSLVARSAYFEQQIRDGVKAVYPDRQMTAEEEETLKRIAAAAAKENP
jgi:hypothetical protein